MNNPPQYMGHERRSAPGWGVRERRSNNPWVDMLMCALGEQKDELKKQTALLVNIDRRLTAVEELMPNLKPMARAWEGAGILSRVWIKIAAVVGIVFAAFEFMTRK